MSARVTALTLVVGCLCAGCGASDRAADVGAVAQRFQTALKGHHGRGACAELSEEAILRLELPTGAELAKARVYVTSASVSLAQGGTLFLNEATDGWEVAAAGCRPAAAELPYDCELEG